MKGKQPMLSAHYSFSTSANKLSALCLTEQKAVEKHIHYGTSQCRSFHIVCTFDNGDVEFLHPSVSATVLKGGEHNGTWGAGRIIVSISGLIPFPTSAMLPVRQPSCTSFEFDILQIADSSNTLQSTNLVQQSAMYRMSKQRPCSMASGQVPLRASSAGRGFSLSTKTLGMRYSGWYPMDCADGRWYSLRLQTG